MIMCVGCGHEHTGPELGGICIGCPCPLKGGQVDTDRYPDVREILAQAWALGWGTGWDDHAAGAGSLARPGPTITPNPFDHPAGPIPPQGG